MDPSTTGRSERIRQIVRPWLDVVEARRPAAATHLRMGAASLAAGALALVGYILWRGVAHRLVDTIRFDAILLFGVVAMNTATAMSLLRAARIVGRSDAEARRSSDHLEKLVEKMPIGVAVVRSGNVLVLANERYRALLHIPGGDRLPDLSRSGIRVFDKHGRPMSISRWPSTRALESGEIVRDEELLVEHENGECTWLSVSAAPLRDDPDGGATAVAAIVDVTRQKLDDEEKKRLREGVNRAQEDERLNIARELHDEFGQGLTALSIALKAAAAEVGDDDRAKLRLSDMRSLVDDLSRRARDLTVKLRPLLLDDVGLGMAVEDLVLGWGERMGILVDLDVGGVPERLPRDVGIVVYRIVQESLTNVARHAAATSVSVTIRKLRSMLRVVIEDDGVGFDPAEVPSGRKRRFGIYGMVERVGSVGGTIEIESRIGKGTTVLATLPLGKE